MNESPAVSRWTRWAQLVRLPNVFTVIADVAAAYLLLAGGPAPITTFSFIVISGVALYWAGMILNDVLDVDRDRRERPSRPIPAGHISLVSARRAGWWLLVIGIGFAFASTPTAGVIAIALATMIVAYDGPLKSTPLAPLAMGSCRVLSFMLGATAGWSIAGAGFLPGYAIAIAAGFGIYITGITTMARHEATGGRRDLIAAGMLLTFAGIALLALSPTWMGSTQNWFVDPNRTFPILIGLLGLPVIVRALTAVAQPVPENIQNTIRVGILSIIPLAASFAFLGAGRIWGLTILALMIPALTLAARFRVT